MSDPYYVTDLESGTFWANNKTGVTITYAFWNSTPTYDDDPSENSGFQTFTATMRACTLDALSQLSSYANVTFSQISSPTPANETTVQIGFGMADIDLGAEAYTYYPDTHYGPIAGDVWANVNYYTTFFDNSPDPTASHVVPGNYDYLALIHEIGHAMGLKHPFEAPTLPPGEDNQQYSVMSYTNPDNYGGDFGLYPETYMIYDIATIQALYGVNTTYHNGTDNYVLNANHIYTIWDAGGNDTMDGSLQTIGITLDMRAGHFSTVGDLLFDNGFTISNNIAIAFGTVIENANGGSGNDTIYDNSAANNIQANGGNDIIFLSSGNDTVSGGDGNDTVYLAVGNEVIDGGNDTDTVIFNGSYYDYSYVFDIPSNTVTVTGTFGTDTLSNDEDFVFTDTSFSSLGAFQTGLPTNTIDGDPTAQILTGGVGHDIISGMDGNDTLYGLGGPDLLFGGAGNDTLYGGDQNDILDGGAGTDTLAGGAGNDTYIVDVILVSGAAKLQDIVTELAGEGTDTLRLRASGTLPLLNPATIILGATLENLDASQTGSNKFNLTGNAASNVLTGNDWDNTINGGAGTLATDTLIGGLGNDTFILNHSSDAVTENSGEGTDTVVIAYAGSGTVSLASFANVENLKVTGSGLYNLQGDGNDNVLTGNSSANVMTGGDGNDTYVIAALDTVIETPTGGIDTIVSSLTFSLASVSNVENLTLGGTGNINGTGDGNDNILIGNAGANILDGGGGADTMFGGGGSDTYIVDNIGDTATETSNLSGTDTVKSGISFSLATNGVGVENLVLTGTGNIDGTGNALANAITGNSGNNTLDGGQGVDKLSGGFGNDIFIVDIYNFTGVAKMADSVGEVSGAGTDTLELRANGDLGLSSPSTILLMQNVENFDATLTGTNRLNLTGNTLNNTITGNDGDNTLSGGAGADALYGGNGNDTLVVDSVFDNANGGNGIDTVLSSFTWNLGTGFGIDGSQGHNNADVENLTLSGTQAANGIGNDLDNTLTGNSAHNVLDGGVGADHLLGMAGNDAIYGGLDDDIIEGGQGLDTLAGGAGSDTFVFHALDLHSPADLITDFTAGGGGDVLDIHDIISGYSTGSVDGWVHMRELNGNTIVSVALHGPATGATYIDVATLVGQTGLGDADALLATGNLILL